MKRISIYISILLLALVFAGCGGGGGSTSKTTVYIPGSLNNMPAIWVDGAVKQLSNKNGVASDVAIAPDGTEYAGGWINDGPDKAALWKDGVADFTTYSSESYIESVAVSADGSLYVLTSNTSAIELSLWKNGTRQTNLTTDHGLYENDGKNTLRILPDGKICVSGRYDNGSEYVAALWIDGSIVAMEHQMGWTESAAISFIIGADGKMYTAGAYYDGTTWHAALWIDSAFTPLQTLPGWSWVMGTGVAVAPDGTVYVSGFNGPYPYQAILWTDGMPEYIFAGQSNSWADDVAVLPDGTVYIVDSWSTRIWKNGEVIDSGIRNMKRIITVTR